MGAEQPRVQSNAADPLGDKASVLAGCHTAVRATMSGEQELAWAFARAAEILIDRVTGLLTQFKSDRTPGLLLTNRCAIRRVSASGDILDPNGDKITAPKLAVEHGKVASATSNLTRPDRPNVLGSQRRLRPHQLPFVPRHSLGCGGRIHLILRGILLDLVTEAKSMWLQIRPWN
jgi:hypothetical protein